MYLVWCNKNDRDEFISQLNEDVEIQGATFIDGYQFCENHIKKIECTASLPLPHFAKQVKIIQPGKKLKL